MSETTYVSVTDTAKEIRKTLKLHFAGVKFSVRSKSYSGGASVNVSWTDGPTEQNYASQLIRTRFAYTDLHNVKATA